MGSEESHVTRKFYFFSKIDINIGWGKCMPIAFEIQQGLPCVFTNLPNLIYQLLSSSKYCFDYQYLIYGWPLEGWILGMYPRQYTMKPITLLHQKDVCAEPTEDLITWMGQSIIKRLLIRQFRKICGGTVWPEPIFKKVSGWRQIPLQHQSKYRTRVIISHGCIF